MFDHPRGRYALATFDLDSAVVCDLDNAEMLSLSTYCRPASSRDNALSLELECKHIRAGATDGISWWSYYAADWTSYGIWNTEKLRLTDTGLLATAAVDVGIATSTIIRLITTKIR